MLENLQTPCMMAFGGDEAIAVIAIGGGLTVAVVAIVTSAISRVVRTKAFEASRREIAAYVAEGTIKPDEAARLLEAGKKPGDCA
ncbi:MAG: hypothetical protein IT435_11265 [Phycisphaerales bacterium]|nr:hypothetical protein [Phycisphaerales bacterium]